MPLADHRPQHVTVSFGGRSWSGQFYEQPEGVCVASAYGSRTRPAGRLSARRRAELTLLDLVKSRTGRT